MLQVPTLGSQALLQAAVRTPADVAALQSVARRRETACGKGCLTWHIWGTGPVVVLLHGGSGSWTHWARNVAALAEAGFTALVPDMPGFGESSAPPEGEDADALPPWLEAGLQELLGAGTSFVSSWASHAAPGRR